MTFAPRFSYHDGMVNQLMEIAQHREFADHVSISAASDLRLKYDARQRSTHSSTLIEGNPIARNSIGTTIADKRRDPTAAQMEVRNYWRALEWIAEVVVEGFVPDEAVIRRLHAIIFSAGRGRPRDTSDYRADHMRITDSRTGAIDYIAPEPADVPVLMEELVGWWKSEAAAKLPAPIRAGILAHRFVTIHPFNDGNGRTTRALATLELWRSGYSFRGYLALEDYYAVDLSRYYEALQMGLHHNYYFGRHDPDLTPWLTYFVETLLRGAREVRGLAEAAAPRSSSDDGPRMNRRFENLILRCLVQAFEQGEDTPEFTAPQIADWFGISDRTAREWLAEWRSTGEIEPLRGDQRITAWQLSGRAVASMKDALSAIRRD